jgi:hypothetical protein
MLSFAYYSAKGATAEPQPEKRARRKTAKHYFGAARKLPARGGE